MILSSIPPQTALTNPNPPYQTNCNLLFVPHKPHNSTPTALCRTAPLSLPNASSSAPLLRHVNHTHNSPADNSNNNINNNESGDGGEEDNEDMVASALAVEAVIRKVSTSPVEFVQRIESRGAAAAGDGGGGGLVLPSVDFQRLCLEQLDLFRRIVGSDAILSVSFLPFHFNFLLFIISFIFFALN